MSSMSRSASAPLRMRSRYSSVLESALVGLGREDAVILSARKKRRYDGSPARGLVKAKSAPERRLQDAAGDDEDPFAGLKLLKSLKKRKKRQKAREEQDMASPAVTRSASKLNQRHARCYTGVLEMAGHTPVTRSMTRRVTQSSSLETIEDVERRLEAEEQVNIQKKLVFPSPAPKKPKLNKEIHKRRVGTRATMCGKKRERNNRKAVILKHWWVDWPLKLKAGSEKVEIQVSGLVDGTMMRFVLHKRQGAVQFTSSDGTYVVLKGKMDRDAARRARIPRAVVKLLEDGIPPFFSKRLRPFVQEGKEKRKTTVSCERVKKRRKDFDKKILSAPMVKKKANGKKEEAMASFSRESKDLVKTRKTPKQTHSSVKSSKKSRTNKVEAESESDAWTEEQLQALINAKLIIPTTASNFWVQVAQYVPGKSAQECQAKTFEHFRSPPTNRKGVKKSIKRGDTDTKSAGSTKIARAGSNKFKKQVREFVEEYKKKHVDDVFETTPSKDGLPDLPEFGAIKSPELATPSHSVADDDSDKEYETLGLLKKISSRRRDDIDSYVLGINRQHVAGGGKMVSGKVRRVTAVGTPSNLAKAKTAVIKNKAVMLVENVGSCSMKAVISPGGTTQVRIDKESSSSENEDDESSEEEANFDIL